MQKWIVIAVFVGVGACGGANPPDQIDGAGPVTCGALGERCCEGIVNGEPAPVCNENTKCALDAGECVEVEPVWYDAARADAPSLPCGGGLGWPCCSSDAGEPYCYAPYQCVDGACLGSP